MEPQTVGLDPQKLAAMDAVIADGLAEKKMPGCVVCIGRHGQIAYLKAYGNKQVEPATVPMTTDTVFDMASITKPVATATSILLLIERGKLSLSDKVSTLIPEFAVNDKQDITVRDLLIHQSGLLADNALADYQNGPAEAMQKIYALKLLNPVGTKFVYSDVNFILLGDIVKRVSGLTVHEFSQKEYLGPLGMKDTGYLPRDELKARTAPTEQRDGHWMQGEVHDPRAYKLDGVAGHAGLFSTADDLAIYAAMMLNGGKFGDTRILTPQTVSLMTRGNKVSSGVRGLGWDKKTGYSINKGDLLTESAFGHGGFTGTVLWIDPELDLFFIFLSNRVHPNGKGLVNPLAGKLATIAASAVTAGPRSPRAVAPSGDVLTGLSVLRDDSSRKLT
ncbi:MAG: serine hydrolase domain-containing protein, partial [Planctomycetaceae bacterium]|nr:serine hydrolase domain-containing protein [Planctomycetaceae bacterium]